VKNLKSRYFLLAPLLFLIPFGAYPRHRANRSAEPFQIRIVDQQSGQGVPNIRLTSDNGILCYARPDGTILWTESSLMDREVYFSIDSPSYRFPGGGKAIRVTHGGKAEFLVSH
jgi:hypothetical protein